MKEKDIVVPESVIVCIGTLKFKYKLLERI